MCFPRTYVAVTLSLALVIPAFAQLAGTSATQSSPQAMALLQKSLAALVGTSTISDVTLSGTARSIAGSDDEDGPAVLKALSTGPARVDLSLPSGLREEVVTTNGNQCLVGSWKGSDGVSHPISNHNLMTDSSWFFPAFTVSRFASPSKYVVSWVGTETWNGRSVEHLSAHQSFDMQLPAGLPNLSHLTQMDLFLDSSTLLPARLTFNMHPDNDMQLDIPIDVVFSDYRAVAGAMVAFHVQKSFNNSLSLDLQFESATLNSGLTASLFNAQ